MSVDRKPTRYAHADGHTDVCYSEDGAKLITCGTDGDIRIWSGFDDDDPVQTCVGEWSLCVRQKGNYLHVATDNNDVQLVTYPEAERSSILARFGMFVNHMAVATKHNLMVIASGDMEVNVLDVSDPKEAQTTNLFAQLPGAPLSVAISCDARLVAASCGDGKLRIWNLKESLSVNEIDCVPKTNNFKNAKVLCRIDFEPFSGETIAYPSDNVVIIMNTTDWSDKTVLMCPEIDSSYSIVQFSPCGAQIAATTQAGDLVVWNLPTKQVVGVTKHAQSLPLCAMVWNPSGNGEIAFCDTHGQLGIAVVTRELEKKSVPHVVVEEDKTNEANAMDFDGFQFEDDELDAENVVSLEKLKNDDELEFNSEKASSRASTPRPRTPETLMQPPFVPSSTPEHLSPRYLCWNDVGIVRSYQDEESNASIEVEFNDASFHNSMMIKNFQGFTMGCLSKTVLALANSSQITGIPLDAGGSKEWSLSSQEEEEVVCVACSDYLLCYATANYLIRVCSVYGTQKAVFAIPGPVVSLSACGYLLLVAYHGGAPRKGDQRVDLMLVKLEGLCIENKDLKSASGPESTVQWLGFTDLGTPALQDSLGTLYLYPLASNLWLPFCDTTKHRANPSDGFFITSILESSQVVRGIRCRGSVYPGFTPRPTLGEIPLEPSFAELGTEKSQLEASLFTWSVLKVENVEKRLKETALKTFALACKNNLDQRALELIEMMGNPHLVTLATKYATKLNKRRLAEKLVQIASTLQAEDDLDELSLSCSIVCTPPPNVVKPPSRKLVLKSSSKRALKYNKPENNIQQNPAANSEDVPGTTNKMDSSSFIHDTSLANISINTQDSIFHDNKEAKNPFLKSRKKPDISDDYNPLSLTDKFAGYNVDEDVKKKQNGRKDPRRKT